MKYFIYVNFNRKVEAFERPLVIMEDPTEYIERITRDFKASDDNAKAKIAEYNIFHVGEFDDNSGKIELREPNVIFNCSTLMEKKDE